MAMSDEIPSDALAMAADSRAPREAASRQADVAETSDEIAGLDPVPADRAIELDPAMLGYPHRGETYRLTGRYEEALADFTRAIELDPGDAWAIASRGSLPGDGPL